jgi:hypothetical protein
MNRRIVLAMTYVALISLIIAACLALTGCGEKEKQKTTKQEVNHKEPEVETRATDKAATEPEETETTEPKKDDTDVAVKVAMDSARSNNPDLPELRVVEVRIINGEWARVVLEPVDRSTDAATWFMKKTNGKWTVFDFGTAIMPENYPEAPAELFE